MSHITTIIAICIVAGTTSAAVPHCCNSRKFFAKGLIVGSTFAKGSTSPTMSQNSFEMDSDYNRKLYAINGTNIVQNEQGEFTDYYQVLYDFNKMKHYNFNDTHCQIDQLDSVVFPDGCVPKTLAHFGPYTMGSGSESMHVNGWAGRVGNLTLTYATSVDDCIFVSYTRFGTLPDGSKIAETAQFVDVVKDRNSYDGVFNVPQHCNTGVAAVGK